jgi:hypothetical protein
MLRNLAPEPIRRGTELLIIWFQQDGATAHTARTTMEVIQEVFLEHITSVHSELSCPAHLPNLSACVYFLVGTSK